jgi:hypothetical protein
MAAESMIPCTPEVIQTMMYRVTDVLLEYGVLQPPTDDSQEEAERFSDSAMKVFQTHGFVNSDGDVAVGRCMLLPSHDAGLSLLLITPCPVDEYDDNLQRKPSQSASNGRLREPLFCRVGGFWARWKKWQTIPLSRRSFVTPHGDSVARRWWTQLFCLLKRRQWP